MRDAFAQWASLQVGAPREVASLIEHIEESSEHAGLLDTEIHGRRVVWRSVPAHARARITNSVMRLETVDVWNVEPASLRALSDHVATCTACGGQKKFACVPCAGTGKTLCPACNGGRKSYGHAANGAYRLLNCTNCRGKGQLDCAACRRGIATCGSCEGEGRVQRWLEIESWSRRVVKIHPEALALQFEWGESPSIETIRRDAEVLLEIDHPHVLAPSDLDGVPPQWFEVLAATLMPGERVTRQCLRIARVPRYGVEYRLGHEEGQVSFTGLRLIGPASELATPFERRSAQLRSLRRLLLMIGFILAIVSLGRGLFLWNVATFLSLLASAAALVSIYAAAADWTAGRARTRRWLAIGTSNLVIAIALALVALPRAGHAQRLIASSQLDGAESELRALGDEAPLSLWADLRLARIREATGVAAARGTLASIPSELPQHAAGTDTVDALILRSARDDARRLLWARASESLALLSPHARERPEMAPTATVVYIPMARQRIAVGDWSRAADMIVAARAFRVAPAALDPLISTMHKAGLGRVARAKRLAAASERLNERLVAEETLVSWERASDLRGTPLVITLRTAMARDVAAVERAERKRRPS
ncbi:MAG TPA: hypothetical protein VEK79_14115 [Thermoanaerobaculia bacterium]|nr:hypothetical protein [Thermoanaerobaculia bacterium]